MIAAKFDPQQFFRRADAVALQVAASEVFSLLKRSLELPAAWAALVTAPSGEFTLVPSGGRVNGDGSEQVLFLRATPIEVGILEQGLTTRDGFQCSAEFKLRSRLLIERTELVSFQQAVLGGHRAATTERLTHYLQPSIRETLLQFAAEHDAADLMGAAGAAALSEALGSALQPLCFSGGLVLDGAVSPRIECPAYRRVLQTRDESAQRHHEHEASRPLEEALKRARFEHVDHLSKLLAQLSQLASASPGVALSELIRTFNEHQRGQLYEALFASETPMVRTRWLIVAVGEEVLFFDPRSPAAPQRRLTMAGEVGPVRSVRATRNDDGQAVLWLGASLGVYRLPIERAEPDRVFHGLGSPSVRGGFNSVVAVGDRVFASHSELGIVEWSMQQPAAPRVRFESMTRGAKAVRGLDVLDGDLYCAIDDRVIRWHSADDIDRTARVYSGSRSTLTALCVSHHGLFAGNSEGDILHWRTGKDSEPQCLYAGNRRAVESVRTLTTQGVNRLVYSDTSMHIHSKVLDDSFVCRYEAGGQTLRRVDVASDLLVATTELRDRLICWEPGKPPRPIGTIPISAICGRTIQDVCLVSEA